MEARFRRFKSLDGTLKITKCMLRLEWTVCPKTTVYKLKKELKVQRKQCVSKGAAGGQIREDSVVSLWKSVLSVFIILTTYAGFRANQVEKREKVWLFPGQRKTLWKQSLKQTRAVWIPRFSLAGRQVSARRAGAGPIKEACPEHAAGRGRGWCARQRSGSQRKDVAWTILCAQKKVNSDDGLLP